MNPLAIAAEWCEEYGPIKAMEMARTMLDQARSLGESDKTISSWQRVCDHMEMRR